MSVNTQAGVGRKEPERQEKEEKYPHRGERRKKTKEWGRQGPEKERGNRNSQGRGKKGEEGGERGGADREGLERGRHPGWSWEMQSLQDTPFHTFTHAHTLHTKPGSFPDALNQATEG